MTSTDTSRADALTDRAKWAIRLLEVAEPILDAAAAGKPVTIAAGDLLRQVRIFLPAAVPPVEQHEAAPAGAQRSGDPWDRGAVCPVCAGKPGEWTCPKTTNDMYNPRPEATCRRPPGPEAPADDAKLGAFVRRLAVSLSDSPKSFLANVVRAIEDLKTQPEPRAADERELPANDGYFVHDRAGGHVDFYDTNAERDAAHRDAINEYRREAQHDQEWPTDVEGIVSGVVTDTTGERKAYEDSYEFEPRAVPTQARASSPNPAVAEGATFQARVQPWMLACFGAEIAADRVERNHRFLEEALELVQACGCTASEAHQLVDYTFGRPIGEPAQEVGGVVVTLAALCLANGLDMHAAGETELARIWTKVEQIRAKQAAKPKHSPLPEAPAPASAPVGLTSDLRAELEWCATEGNCGPRTRSAIHQVLAAFPRQPEPRAEVAGSVARDICVSLECTAQWLEHGNDPKAAAIEIRMQIKKLARAGDAS